MDIKFPSCREVMLYHQYVLINSAIDVVAHNALLCCPRLCFKAVFPTTMMLASKALRSA